MSYALTYSNKVKSISLYRYSRDDSSVVNLTVRLLCKSIVREFFKLFSRLCLCLTQDKYYILVFINQARKTVKFVKKESENKKVPLLFKIHLQFYDYKN